METVSLDAINDYIYEKVFEEFWITTGVPLDHKEIVEYQHLITSRPFDLTKIPKISVKYRCSQGGLHKDDVAIYAVFFGMKGAELGESWTFSPSDEEETHWSVEYDDTDPKVSAALELIGMYFRFKALASNLILKIYMPLQMRGVTSVSKEKLDEELKIASEEYWVEQKKMELASAKQMEAAFERMLRGMPLEERKRFAESVTDKEAEKRLRKILDRINGGKKGEEEEGINILKKPSF